MSALTELAEKASGGVWETNLRDYLQSFVEYPKVQDDKTQKNLTIEKVIFAIKVLGAMEIDWWKGTDVEILKSKPWRVNFFFAIGSGHEDGAMIILNECSPSEQVVDYYAKVISKAAEYFRVTHFQEDQGKKDKS